MTERMPRQGWVPWHDRAGRFSLLRLMAFLFLMYPAAHLLKSGLYQELGAEPLKAALHETGRWTIRFLLVSLAITPLREALSWPRLLIVRRMIGVGTAGYALLHLALYGVYENGRLWLICSEIGSHFYLLIGLVALCGLVVLAVTSTDSWMRRLGRRWKKLHRAVYVLMLLALAHGFIQAKIDISQESVWSGIFCALMAWRLWPRQHRGWGAAIVLSLAAIPATALLEAAWYGLVRGLNWHLVLSANWPPDLATAWRMTITLGPRPAWEVAVLACMVIAAVSWRRWFVSRQQWKAAERNGG
ncbi:protein-methionine-sulfoxide reductase heme-binding subunit MsrQ [Granulibacter bethesdensis]|uniref:sulfite oxidase heme-binding subunit YedZ n=1 Tax=Granulibacter bethesdensis TaxID=364410 RepID=UPI00090AD1B2|nr:protein-methionine-sulfoxide reductase heme-binding subunit MsrQ [Granulibacter bethesdensis]APH60291.1 putative membrane spanning protein [Granulibacter bethesdensis]